MTWMQTRKGTPIDLEHPDPALIDFEEAAYSLAGINRFLNHTFDPYSVAEHCVRVSVLIQQWGHDRDMQMRGLVHDVPEMFLGDITAPVKRFLRKHTDALDVLEDRWLYAVLDKLGLPHMRSNPPMPMREWEETQAVIKRADLVMLSTERRDHMADCERDWKLDHAPNTRKLAWPLCAPAAERAFLDRFEELGGAVDGASWVEQPVAMAVRGGA